VSYRTILLQRYLDVTNLSYLAPRNNEEFVTFCSKLDVKMVRFISFFLEGATKVREEWLNEFS
jgi:hypothetical protein